MCLVSALVWSLSNTSSLWPSLRLPTQGSRFDCGAVGHQEQLRMREITTFWSTRKRYFEIATDDGFRKRTPLGLVVFALLVATAIGFKIERERSRMFPLVLHILWSLMACWLLLALYNPIAASVAPKKFHSPVHLTF